MDVEQKKQELRDAAQHSDNEYLRRISQDMRETLLLIREVVRYMKDAESEIPEKMRRFIMYMHDVHDVMWMYTEQGHEPPGYVKREAERCDDRYRQLLQELHMDGGTFERVRREMSADKDNRWDHTRALDYKRPT